MAPEAGPRRTPLQGQPGEVLSVRGCESRPSIFAPSPPKTGVALSPPLLQPTVEKVSARKVHGSGGAERRIPTSLPSTRLRVRSGGKILVE